MNVLVIGKGKTGTTVISKAIQHSIKDSEYILEPKKIEFFEQRIWDKSISYVVKIIFEHWQAKPQSFDVLLNNKSPLQFDKKIVIVRDLRDELISRLMYIIYPWVLQKGFDKGKLNRWLSILRKKERNPGSFSFVELIGHLDEIFSTNFLNCLAHVNPYHAFISKE